MVLMLAGCGSHTPSPRYYLTIPQSGICALEYDTSASTGGCRNADYSAFRKGETVLLEWLDGMEDIAGTTLRALDAAGNTVWSCTLPNRAQNGWVVSRQD